MRIASKIVLLSLLLVTCNAHAENITKLNSFQIKIPSNAIDESEARIKDMGLAPYCLAYDSQETITFDYKENSDPLPKLTVASCQSGATSQSFIFENGLIKSNDLCLTRENKDFYGTHYDTVVAKMLVDARGCYQDGYGYTQGSFSSLFLKHNLALRACDGGKNQVWKINNPSDTRYLQIKNGNECVSVSGRALSANMAYGLGSTLMCNRLAYSVTSIRSHQNEFEVHLKNCEDPTTKFPVENNFLIIEKEKIVPIIMSN